MLNEAPCHGNVWGVEA